MLHSFFPAPPCASFPLACKVEQSRPASSAREKAPPPGRIALGSPGAALICSAVESANAHSTRAKNPRVRRYLAVCLALFWPSLRDLLRLSLAEDTYSHILLVPFINVGLILMNRHGRFDPAETSVKAAAAFFLAGILLFAMSWRFGSQLPGGDPLAFAVLPFVVLVWAGFLFFYGLRVFRSLEFPLLFLLLAVPIPQSVVDTFIEWLRIGSAEV